MSLRGSVFVLFLLVPLPSAQAASETQISQTTGAVDSKPYRLLTAVASSGNGYLVVWGAADSPDITVLNDHPMTIYIRAFGADGVPKQQFATAVGMGQRPSIAWNGHEYLVVWGITTPTTGSLPTPSVAGIRVREDGSLVDPAPVTLVSEVNPFSYRSTCVWNGSQYLVTWNRGMALVDADLLHARLVLLPPVGGEPLYAATSGGSFIVLSEVFIGTSSLLNLVPVSAAGDLGTVTLLNGGRGNIVGVDGGYLMILDDEVSLRFSRLRGDGTLLSTSIVGPGSTGFPRIATRDGRIVASWEQIPDVNHTRVCTARLDIQTQTVCSAVTAGVQHDPAIATSSESVLLAWSERVNGRDTVRVIATLHPNTPRADLGSSRSADVASPVPAAERHSDGTVAAAWSEYNQTHLEVHLGGLTSKSAKLPEGAVFATALDQTSPALAAGAGRTMLVWTEGPPLKIRMTIVDDVSKAVIATLPLATGIAPSVAFDGNEWLVTWQSIAASSVIGFAIINSDGNVLSSGNLSSIAASPIAISQTSPAVTWSGKTFFVTWRESSPSGQPASDRIQLTTITAAGAPSSPLTLDSTDAALVSPSVATNGDRVLVSWGRPGNTLRQALFDSSGRQLGKFIDFSWPYAVVRTRTHAMTGGFATLSGSRVALTSLDGVALDTINIDQGSSTGDFVVDPANRLTFIYTRTVGNTNAATFAQTIGLPRRHPQNR
jgi:hypothetical protein